MSWSVIKNQGDAASFMTLFGGFHDGCLREAHLWTGHWVPKDLSMTCSDSLDNCIRILVQRQFKDPFAIELLFGEVARFNLVPSPKTTNLSFLKTSFWFRMAQSITPLMWVGGQNLQVEMKSLWCLQNDFGGVEWNG